MTAKEENKTEEINEIEEDEKKKRKIVIPGEKIVSGKEFLPGDGTRREKEEIVASRFGLTEISDRLIRVIPLSGTYMPREGNVVIGKITDVTFNGWIIDLGAPCSSFLSVSEFPRYIKGDLSEYYAIGEVLVCRVESIKHNSIDLTIRGRGLGKLEKGIIININSNKVPRVIGREGSMIKLIKQETNCDIVVGQNGVVWISGDKVENELKAKEAILFVTSKSFIEGLTEKVKDFLEGKRK